MSRDEQHKVLAQSVGAVLCMEREVDDLYPLRSDTWMSQLLEVKRHNINLPLFSEELSESYIHLCTYKNLIAFGT